MDERTREQSAEDADNEFAPPRRPIKSGVIIGITILVALLVAGGFFTATKFIGSNANVIPTPTLVPGSNLFYVQTTPSWGSILIDGQKLAHLPDPTVDEPLQLSVGVHEVVWQASPFASQRCTVVVPPQVSETKCLENDPVSVNKGPDKGLTGLVISFTASLSDLPAAQRTALIHTAQTALDALQASDTVQPGEHFANLNANQFIDTASSQLRATVHFSLDTDINSPHPCVGEFIGYGSPCLFNGQDCHTFCTVKELPNIHTPQNRWDVFGIMGVSWSYTTPGGQMVAQNQPDETDNSGNEYMLSLFITWDGSQWHVKTSVNDGSTAYQTSGPACSAAYIAITQAAFRTYTTVSVPGDPYQSLYWNAQNGSNLAAGCLLTAYPSSNMATPGANPSPIAHIFYRFGVPLALDTTTQRYWPNLPLASAYEQTIAQHIATQKP